MIHEDEYVFDFYLMLNLLEHLFEGRSIFFMDFNKKSGIGMLKESLPE